MPTKFKQPVFEDVNDFILGTTSTKVRIKKPKEYYEKHRLSRKIAMNNFRATKFGAKGFITTSEWAEIKNLYSNRCAFCGIASLKLEIEHIWPLSLANKGLEISQFATNEIDNILPVCRFCNQAKGTKPFIIMLGWKNSMLE